MFWFVMIFFALFYYFVGNDIHKEKVEKRIEDAKTEKQLKFKTDNQQSKKLLVKKQQNTNTEHKCCRDSI